MHTLLLDLNIKIHQEIVLISFCISWRLLYEMILECCFQ